MPSRAPLPRLTKPSASSKHAEQELAELELKAERAAWVQLNFITFDTENIAADAEEAANTAATNNAKLAHRYDSVSLHLNWPVSVCFWSTPLNFRLPMIQKRRRSLPGFSLRWAAITEREMVP